MRVRGASAAAFWGALQLAAAVATSAGAGAQTAQVLTPPVDQNERADARDAYSAGLAAFARGAYNEAAREFTRASGSTTSPNAKLMLGRCLHQLQQLPEAYRVLITIVRPPEALDPRYGQTRSAAEDELRVLRSQIGILTVYVRADDRSALLHVDGQPIRPTEWNSALPVRPGVVRLSLETASGVIERREVEIGAGQRASIVIGSPEDMAEGEAVQQPATKPMAAKSVVRRPVAARAETIEAPQPGPLEPSVASSPGPSALRIGSYIAGGTSALSFVAFGILGTLSTANFAKLEAGCPNRSACDASLESIAARGHTQQVLANVALIAGATTFVAGAVMFVVSEPPEKKKANSESARSARRARTGVVSRKSLARDAKAPESARFALAITPLGVALRGQL